MSTHIGASAGEIAPLVLMPGDPLRAKWIAETFLDDAKLYTEIRGMLGFTGTWQGHPVSVQGSGMGQPSAAIYVTELFKEYDVQSVIRVGSCGGLSEKRRHPRRRHRVGRVHRLLDEPASASRASTTPRSPTSACSARPRTPPSPPTCRWACTWA